MGAQEVRTNKREFLTRAIKERNVWVLCKHFFGFELTPTQEKIVRVIAFKEHRRVAINCMTRYGKTRCVTMGVALYILFNENKKIYLISASDGQAAILRNYLSELLVTCEELQALCLEEKAKGAERLRKELSRKRITFTNGCELNTISAQGEADRLMGHGGDLIIEDEASLINESVFNGKISRMLGDSSDSILVELANPWNNSGHYFKHWNDPKFYKIHVGWEHALKEGRITKEFVEEQKEELLPLEFNILYNSVFPEQSQDALYNHEAIKDCYDLDWKLEAKDVIIACDVADKGMDETVIIKAVTDGTRYEIVETFSEPKTEQTALAGRILRMQQEEPIATIINIDEIGYGAGVLSMVKEGLRGRKTCTVSGCHFGKTARKKNRFINKKAEEYFRNAQLINHRLIKIPKNNKLVTDLLSMGWENTSMGKIRIVDPDNKSPDWADALVYMTWKPSSMAF